MRNSIGLLRRLGLVFLIVGLTAAGCHNSDSSASDEGKEPVAKKPAAPIPADSPLAKIKTGMGMKEVSDTIGQPTDMDSRMTGKGFNPFYYGGDTHRVVWRYKGQGRITFTRDHAFTNTMRVYEVEYDPAERGYN